MLQKIYSKLRTRGESAIVASVSLPRLMTVQLDITNACNLSCSHCYHPNHSNKGALSLNDWKSILDKIEIFLRKYKCTPSITFCGGEPLLSPLLKPLISEIDRRWPDLEILILTNGTMYKNSIFQSRSSNRTSFQVSLDGPDEVSHDQVRGKGSFQRSVAGISQILANGHPVSILSILSQRSAPRIADYFSLAKTLGVNSQNFTRLIAEGHGRILVDSKTDLPLAGIALKEALTDILVESYRSGVPTNTNQPLFALLDTSFGQNGLFGFDSIIVDYKGNLKASSRSSLILGNILQNNLEDLYIKNSVLNEIRGRKIDVCGACELFEDCGGDRNAAFAEYGSFTARDPGCWK